MGSKDPIRKNLGLRLKAARESAKMTQQFVADLFDVGKGTVSAWETGGGDPGIYVLRRLSKLYDVTADSLLWDESPSREAQKIAVQYDNLSDLKRKQFDAMWSTHFVEAVSDSDVVDAFATKSSGKYKQPPTDREQLVPAPRRTANQDRAPAEQELRDSLVPAPPRRSVGRRSK